MKLKRKAKTEPIVEIKETSTEPKFHNLDEVMDRTHPFSIIYSGVENRSYFNGCYDMGVRNFLMSFHYLQNSKEPLSVRLKDHEDIRLFIDSGAYTYWCDPKYAEKTVDFWEKHLQNYLKWAEKNKDHIFAIASFDYENLVGGEKVLEWNEKYLEPFMLRTGIPVCFVWHENSARDWEYYCKRYPYVGFSSTNTNGEILSMQDYLDKLQIAEKHDTLVHGFGMTRTSMLPQLPYYTVDSTSWKMGFMYGQLAFWNGKKVQMVRKDEFETKAFKYIRTYDIDPPLDEEKLKDYYEPEVLRANVYAYQKAEESIRNALKPRMYWLKTKSVKRQSIDDVKFPSVEWCDSKVPQEDWREYAKSFNVSQEDKQTAINCITDITVLLHWENPDFTEYRDTVYNSNLIKELHDLWINRIVQSDEDRIEDLQKFYTNVLLGEETKLLYLGTNFDKVVKEREEYVDDAEYEMEDVSDMEIQNLMSKFLPQKEDGSAPEIDELDDELFMENDIVPVRDSKGRFIKGQRQVLKPKKLYSKKYPKLACDTCYNAQKCPEYKAGYACAYNKMFDRFDTRDMGDIIQAMQGIVDFNLGRLQRAMLAETLNGGVPDPMVSTLMSQNMSMLNQLKQMYEYGNQEVIKQTKIMRSDGTQETTTQVSNPQKGGILEKLFSQSKMNDDEEEIKEQEETAKEENESNIVDAE